MKFTTLRAAQLVATALVLTAVTQLVYVMLEGSGKSHIAYPIWRTEVLLALVVAISSFMIVRHNALVGGCLVIAGIFNVIQTGMGLTMFYQLGYGGEAPPNPVFFPVLLMSFFLYFAAKTAIGLAAAALGMELWKADAGPWRNIGLLAMLAGLVALLLNAAAMILGLGVVTYAGAAGVVAAVFTAITLLRVCRHSEA